MRMIEVDGRLSPFRPLDRIDPTHLAVDASILNSYSSYLQSARILATFKERKKSIVDESRSAH